MRGGYRQEVFNVLLAQLLQERGLVTAPESVLKVRPESVRRMPDVIVDYFGLRTAIEGEVSDQADAEARASISALRRVEEGIAHIAIAIIYPEYLRKQKYSELKDALLNSEMFMSVITESEDTGYFKGNIELLEGALRHAFDRLVQEDVVSHAVAILEAGIGKFASIVIGKEGIMERTAQILGIRELPVKESTGEESP